MKACRGSRGNSSTLVNVGTRWRQVVNFGSGYFTPEKETPVLIKQKTEWAHSRSGRCGGEKNLLPLPGNKCLNYTNGGKFLDRCSDC
jgi:hypothetical protein